jgi:tRNA dimethylallyltransferase
MITKATSPSEERGPSSCSTPLPPGGQPSLIIITGPTASGKTELAIEVALRLGACVVSADSRQFYRRLKIGVASPGPEELASVKHHFIGHLDLADTYNVCRFAQDALRLLGEEFRSKKQVVMAGGSGLYLDAVCRGIDDLPDADPDTRAGLQKVLAAEGIAGLQQRLKALDPAYYDRVDLKNPNRLMRALEVCMITGRPYSSFRKNKPRERDFRILKIGLLRERDELGRLIDERVDRMMAGGLLEEVTALLPFRHLNALNTVGYCELFAYLDGECTLGEAVRLIKADTRRYAKRQMTWFRKDPSIRWYHPDDRGGIFACIGDFIGE